jgi:hypothetical protein
MTRIEPEHEVDRVGVTDLDEPDGRRRQRGPISAPTWADVNPTPSALFGSTRTWTSGAAFTRSLVMLSRPSTPASAAWTASVVDARRPGPRR